MMPQVGGFVYTRSLRTRGAGIAESAGLTSIGIAISARWEAVSGRSMGVGSFISRVF